MRKADINFAVDLAAFIFFILLISTGFLIYLILPAGSGHLTIWSLNRHAWGDIHFWIAMGFLSMIGLHLILHWSWIKSMITRNKTNRDASKKRIFIIIAALLIALILAAAPYFSSIESTGQKTGGQTGQIELLNE